MMAQLIEVEMSKFTCRLLKLLLQLHNMIATEKINEVVTTYLMHREELPIAEAASATIDACLIPPFLLVDVFNAAQLDPTRSDKDADLIRMHRNELLGHFRSQQ